MKPISNPQVHSINAINDGIKVSNGEVNIVLGQSQQIEDSSTMHMNQQSMEMQEQDIQTEGILVEPQSPEIPTLPKKYSEPEVEPEIMQEDQDNHQQNQSSNFIPPELQFEEIYRLLHRENILPFEIQRLHQQQPPSQQSPPKEQSTTQPQKTQLKTRHSKKQQSQMQLIIELLHMYFAGKNLIQTSATLIKARLNLTQFSTQKQILFHEGNDNFPQGQKVLADLFQHILAALEKQLTDKQNFTGFTELTNNTLPSHKQYKITDSLLQFFSIKLKVHPNRKQLIFEEFPNKLEHIYIEQLFGVLKIEYFKIMLKTFVRFFNSNKNDKNSVRVYLSIKEKITEKKQEMPNDENSGDKIILYDEDSQKDMKDNFDEINGKLLKKHANCQNVVNILIDLAERNRKKTPSKKRKQKQKDPEVDSVCSEIEETALIDDHGMSENDEDEEVNDEENDNEDESGEDEDKEQHTKGVNKNEGKVSDENKESSQEQNSSSVPDLHQAENEDAQSQSIHSEVQDQESDWDLFEEYPGQFDDQQQPNHQDQQIQNPL